MSWHQRILTSIAAALGVVIVLAWIHHLWLSQSTEAYIAQLKAQGEPMELVQVLPPRVPLNQNSAGTLRRAVALFDADNSWLQTNYVYGMQMMAPGRAMVRWQQPEIRDVYGTNSWDDVAAAISQNEKSFALLQQIIARPDFDFHIQYELGVTGLDFTNLDLAGSKRMAQRLETAVLCDLHQGDTVAAVKNLRAMLAIVEAMRNERLVISELVRIAMANIALIANWELLQSPNLTDTQLADLQHDWMRLDFIRGNENALEMERVLGGITLRKWRHSNAGLQHYFELGRKAGELIGRASENESSWEKARTAIRIFMWRYWWSYPDELRAERGYEVLLATPRFAETNHSFQIALQDQETRLRVLGISELDNDLSDFFDPGNIDMHSMLSQSIVTLSGTARRTMAAEVVKDMAVTAIALKRYKLKSGNYPETLGLLVPKLIPSVPIDPVDGQPLGYRRNADGTFLLYSVGENGRDDGGNPALENGVESANDYWLNPHALDWVWPQPATPEEVRLYYSHHSKPSVN